MFDVAESASLFPFVSNFAAAAAFSHTPQQIVVVVVAVVAIPPSSVAGRRTFLRSAGGRELLAVSEVDIPVENIARVRWLEVRSGEARLLRLLGLAQSFMISDTSDDDFTARQGP